MSVFVRRYLTDPGPDVLLNIESVDILDLEPPATINGVNTGIVLLVGEFENGPFATPTQVFSTTDLTTTFGSLGYTRNGVPANDCCAVSRSADLAATPEYWNGNGMVQLNGKKFAGLQICRVDTSVGSVSFTRCGAVYGGILTSYDLDPGQVLNVSLNGAAATTVTFNGAAAVVTAVGASYPVTFTGGETLTLSYDGASNFIVTFLSTDSTLQNVIDRINAAAGFTFASSSSSQLRLTGRVRGTSGQVSVVAGSGTVTTTLGLTVATTNGTGNVPNIDAAAVADIKTVVEAGVVGTLVDTTSSGQLRITNVGTPATGTISIASGTTAVALGFTIGTVGSAATSTSVGFIPAGTKVSNAAGTRVFVTMQDVSFTASNAGPYTAKVRHAQDDGTGQAANAGTVTMLLSAPNDSTAFSVMNGANISAALTEAQIDAAYTAAIASTLSQSSVAQTASIIWSARQSNTVRQQIRANVLSASSTGAYGRVGIIRTPLNTTTTLALSTAGAPGVGLTRDQRIVYCYPQASTYVPLIAQRGTGGGTGFTASGVVDVGADGFLASVLSQLNPEENPGQTTTFTSEVLGLESGANVQNFTIDNYIAFKSKGICALRMDSGTAIFQSGISSVDPLVNPDLVNIARRRMADYIQGSIALRAKAYGKKLNTRARRKALLGEILQFVTSLLSASAQSAQRIDGYTLTDKSNTPALLARGYYRIDLYVRTLSSLDAIVLATTIGESVQVEESLNA